MIFKNIVDIKKWLHDFDIKYYVINDDLTVDVKVSVDLSFLDLTNIPIKFRNISGYFYCNDNQLTDFSFMPDIIASHCNIGYNKVNTINYLPKTIGGDLFFNDMDLNEIDLSNTIVRGDIIGMNNKLDKIKFNNNQEINVLNLKNNNFKNTLFLENIKLIPSSTLYLSENKIEELDYLDVDYIRYLDCSHNNIKNLKTMPKIIQDEFNCSYNKLENLFNISISVGSLNCSYNNINSFDFFPIVENDIIIIEPQLDVDFNN